MLTRTSFGLIHAPRGGGGAALGCRWQAACFDFNLRPARRRQRALHVVFRRARVSIHAFARRATLSLSRRPRLTVWIHAAARGRPAAPRRPLAR